MSNVSSSVNAPKSISKGLYFYNDEILADFQARQKITLKEKESVPKDVPSHVGMQTINPKSNVGKYFVEYASASTIHGLNHLVAPHRHPVEKFLAVLFILGALLCLIFLSFLFWDRYQNNATVIVVDNDRERFKILKPALFICPLPNVEETKIPDVFKKHGIEHTPEAEKFFSFLANANYENMLETPLFDKVSPNKWLEILHDLRKDIPPNVLKGENTREIWVTTEKGVCLAMRSIFGVYATLDYWKSNNRTVIPVPDKLPYYEHNNDGAQESVVVDTAWFSACDPFELITYDTPMRWVQPKVLHRVVISISEIKTKVNVRELRIQQRKCKFVSDGGLKTWPVYTRNMCVIECRMKAIEDRCKCRPHFARPDESVNTCNASQLRCIGGITKHLFLYEYPPPSCGCLPKCDVVTYRIKDKEESELNEMPISLSVMTLIIELPQVIYYRSLLYGFTDFLTSVGGAAGLFLGASVLSFVEILYYGTLRIYFYIKQTKRKYKKNETTNLS